MKVNKMEKFGSLNALIGEPKDFDDNTFITVIIWNEDQEIECNFKVNKNDKSIGIHSHKTDEAFSRNENEFFVWCPGEGFSKNASKPFFRKVFPGAESDFLDIVYEVATSVDIRALRKFNDSEYELMIRGVNSLWDNVGRFDFARKNAIDKIVAHLKQGKILAEDLDDIKAGVAMDVERYKESELGQREAVILKKLNEADALRD